MWHKGWSNTIGFGILQPANSHATLNSLQFPVILPLCHSWVPVTKASGRVVTTMTSLTAHESIAASVGKTVLFLSLKFAHEAQMPKQAEALAAVQSVLVSLSPSSPDHGISHGAQTLLPGWEPICRHWATQHPETIPAFWPSTSQLGTWQCPSQQWGLPADRHGKRLCVRERGHVSRGHPAHATTQAPAAAALPDPGCASAAEGRGGSPAWDQAHHKAAGPQSCPGEPWLCLKAKLSTDAGQCRRLCLCGSESVMEMTSRACLGRATHRLLSLWMQLSQERVFNCSMYCNTRCFLHYPLAPALELPPSQNSNFMKWIAFP